MTMKDYYMTMKDYFFRYKWISVIILVGIAFLLPVIDFSFRIAINDRANSYCTRLLYADNTEISDNGEYIGLIQMYNPQEVIIMDRNGECVSEFHSGSVPDEIALGEESYFLLYRGEYEGDENIEKSKIVRLDYQSNVLEERTLDYCISTIACRNGILFMAKWLPNYASEMDINRFYDGFIAHFYVKEDDLQGEVCELQQEQENIEGIDLFYHSAGYSEGFFATEPELEDYPGMVTTSFDFWEEDDEWAWEEEEDGEEEGPLFGQREKKNEELLSNKLMAENESSDWIYSMDEYQAGEKIYGVCNVVTDFNPGGSMPLHKVMKSYSYEIDCSNDQIKILGELPSALALYTTGTDVIYQKKEQIIKRNYASGKEEIIYTINSMRYFCVKLQGKYLLLVDNEESIPIEIIQNE